MKTGKLIVIEGHLDMVEDMVGDLPNTNVLVDDASMKADSRQTMSAKNKLFCYNTLLHLKDGHDVILVAPKLDRLDKRLRRPDITISLEE